MEKKSDSGEIVHTLIEIDPDDFDADELADALNAMREEAEKRARETPNG